MRLQRFCLPGRQTTISESANHRRQMSLFGQEIQQATFTNLNSLKCYRITHSFTFYIPAVLPQKPLMQSVGEFAWGALVPGPAILHIILTPWPPLSWSAIRAYRTSQVPGRAYQDGPFAQNTPISVCSHEEILALGIDISQTRQSGNSPAPRCLLVGPSPPVPSTYCVEAETGAWGAWGVWPLVSLYEGL